MLRISFLISFLVSVSVATNLKLPVSILLDGSDLKDQDSVDSQKSFRISQIILFNCKKGASSSATSRHSLDQEPPLYIRLNIHTQTRSKKLITQLYNLGVSASYDQILQIENQLATAVCQIIEKD